MTWSKEWDVHLEEWEAVRLLKGGFISITLLPYSITRQQWKSEASEEVKVVIYVPQTVAEALAKGILQAIEKGGEK